MDRQFETAVNEKLELWKKNGRTGFNYSDAVEDVVCDALEPIMTDGSFIDKLIEYSSKKTQGKGLIQTIRDFFRDLHNKLIKLHERYKNNNPDDRAGYFFKQHADLCEQLADKCAKALAEVNSITDENISVAETTGGKSTSPKYSIRKGAEDDVKRVLSNKNYTEDVYLTESSPSIIVNQKGVKNLPMLMKASHIRENVFTENEAKQKGLKTDKHTHYHGLGKDLFLKIIDGLDDVKLAYRGTKNAENPVRRENYFLLISQYKDKADNIINVPVYINEKGQYNRVFIDTNKIATVFGRDDFFEYINREIKKGNLVKIKNRSNQASELKATHASSSLA